jgi:hypothetical protein
MGSPALLPILKEGVLQIFIALKNPSPWPGSNPQPLGPAANTLTTTPPRRLYLKNRAVYFGKSLNLHDVKYYWDTCLTRKLLSWLTLLFGRTRVRFSTQKPTIPRCLVLFHSASGTISTTCPILN